MKDVSVDGDGEAALLGQVGTDSWLTAVEQLVAAVELLDVLVWVVLLVFLDGMGEEDAEDMLWEDCSGFMVAFFKDCRFLAILRNL